MLFYKAEDSLSFPCTTFLFAISYQMELLHDSCPDFENWSMKPALKTSVSNTSWVVAVAVPEGLQTALPSTLWLQSVYTRRSIRPGHCWAMWGSRAVQHTAPHGEVTLLSRKHTRASCRCLLSCCFFHLWARRLQCILLTTYLTLPHLAPPKKHGKKSYSETKAQLKDCVFKAVGSWIEWMVGLVRGRELARGGYSCWRLFSTSTSTERERQHPPPAGVEAAVS